MSTEVKTSETPSRDIVDYYLASIVVYMLLTMQKYDDVWIGFRYSS